MDNSKHLNLVVIDDDYMDIELLDRYLYETFPSKYSLDRYSNWEESEISLKDKDLIFVDYYLGCMDAREIISYIRQKHSSIPIIVLTGRGDENIAVDAMKTGADDYMNKNELSPASLRRVIQYVLSNQQMKEERLRLEEALKQSQKMEALGTLAGGIAHDFNNMFAAVTGYLDLLKLRVDDNKARSYIYSLIQVTDNMADLIRRLLSFSQGDLTHKSTVNLIEVVKDVLMILEHTASKSVRINTSIPSEPLIISCNRTMIQQTILNVCLNGIEAMPEGGDLDIYCEETDINRISADTPPDLSDGRYFIISISDSGTGIDEELQARIFEPFFTTKSLGAKKGTGLGLAISWQSIKEHGGTITFESGPDTGSSFKIYLPVSGIEDLNNSSEDPLKVSSKGETILIVDDETHVRESLTEMLIYLGYNPVAFASGEQCIEYLIDNSHTAPLVILDISMPDLNGYECIPRIKELNPDINILICSGHNSSEISRTYPSEQLTILQKPVHINTLAVKIRKLLDG